MRLLASDKLKQKEEAFISLALFKRKYNKHWIKNGKKVVTLPRTIENLYFLSDGPVIEYGKKAVTIRWTIGKENQMWERRARVLSIKS